MAHCPYDKIKNLEPAFVKIRKLEKIKEPKPGIFYLKSQGFLHFHIKNDATGMARIWAHVRDGQNWTDDLDIPAKPTARFLKEFYSRIYTAYENTLGLKKSK